MSNVGFVISVDSEIPLETEICKIVLSQIQEIDHHVVSDDLILKVRVTDAGVVGFGKVPMRHDGTDLICILLQNRIEEQIQRLTPENQGDTYVIVGPLP
tara:strand:- start:252 stop:548 length:297 start_codon:yes stop_codon:yes gene_type:complete